MLKPSESYLMEVCFSPGFDEDLLVLGYSVAATPDSYKGSTSLEQPFV